ncbi:hypothetical protein [Pseudanabaena sp. PCC 6802]|uniref:hypothetical protein n=1 Tax=Pseudanabaena sp. PCC 6802 TaxID=118173 RepID=UPI000348205E|nr:hypothetical protein [Pseudanabaena sp. PCC 6802]
MTPFKQEELSNCTSQDWEGETFYPKPGWVWQYPKPKLQTSYANPLMLSAIEFFHYLTFATQIGLAYTFFSFSDFYAPRCESFFLVAIAPVFQQAASVVPIVLHEYEGWQIAPFKDSTGDRDKFNNDGLRRVAYKLLFVLQAVASGMFCIGVFGTNRWSVGSLTVEMPWTILFVAAVLLWLYVASRAAKTFSLTIDNKLLLPVPLSIAIVYIPIQFAYIIALADLLGWVPALLGVALPLLGGVMEGLGAESTFNQWWHLFAVILLNSAGVVLSFCVARHAMGLL